MPNAVNSLLYSVFLSMEHTPYCSRALYNRSPNFISTSLDTSTCTFVYKVEAIQVYYSVTFDICFQSQSGLSATSMPTVRDLVVAMRRSWNRENRAWWVS